MSNSLDPDKNNILPGLNCLQRLSADDTSRQKVEQVPFFKKMTWSHIQ